jgi:hypothetical protein
MKPGTKCSAVAECEILEGTQSALETIPTGRIDQGCVAPLGQGRCLPSSDVYTKDLQSRAPQWDHLTRLACGLFYSQFGGAGKNDGACGKSEIIPLKSLANPKLVVLGHKGLRSCWLGCCMEALSVWDEPIRGCQQETGQ